MQEKHDERRKSIELYWSNRFSFFE